MIFQCLVEHKSNVAMRIKNFKASVLVLLEVLNERTKFLEMDCVVVGHFRPIDDQGSTFSFAIIFRYCSVNLWFFICDLLFQLINCYSLFFGLWVFLFLSQAGQKSSERLCCAAGLQTCRYFVTRGRNEVWGFLTVSLSWYRMISFWHLYINLFFYV